MIVKNEAHVIIETLNNLSEYVDFNYWVISDTGSTDNTKELIIDYFKEKNIDGELVEHSWEDFGSNRTKALESAYNKTDYLLIFDADDRIYGEMELPNELTFDKYEFKFGEVFSYSRPLLINNRIKWEFRGVLHEFLNIAQEQQSLGQEPTSEKITGDYYVDSGKTGFRSKDPKKYYKDAIILENAYEIEKSKDIGLSNRYAFYCAQSYKDAGEEYYSKSIEWYKKCLTLNNWNQEKYYACLTIGDLYFKTNDIENALLYWCKTIEHDHERIEGIVLAMTHLRKTDNHVMVNALYHKYKNYNANPSLDKLFIDYSKYNYELEYNYDIRR
jgi:tetratricopeptide (TPR) repeat protein